MYPSHVRPELRPFHDRLWVRADLPVWDEVWEELSVPARMTFVREIAPRARFQQRLATPARVDLVPQVILDELTVSGLITTSSSRRGLEAHIGLGAAGFALRIDALASHRLLRESQRDRIASYAAHCFFRYDLERGLSSILEKVVGRSGYAMPNSIVRSFVPCGRWPDWVCCFLTDSLAQPLVQAIETAGGQVFLADVGRLVPGFHHDAIRATLDRLVNHLALVEDLDDDTFRIRVGLLPSVLAERKNRHQPCPPLDVRPMPADVGPEGGLTIPDMRAILLELAGGRARLKQDGMPYQKDLERITKVLEPVPPWLSTLAASISERIRHVFGVARILGLTRQVTDSHGSSFLEPSGEGRLWLALGPEEQYRLLYDWHRSIAPPSLGHASTDARFLNCDLTVVPITTKDRPGSGSRIAHAEEDFWPFRLALFEVFQRLPLDTFVTASSFLDNALHGSHNPLRLGGKDDVLVRLSDRDVLPLDELYQDLGRQLFRALLDRLTLTGAIQVALSDDHGLLVRRRPRLHAYFGQDGAPVLEEQASRVVVQPDFSILLIGTNPAPAADFAVFCDRERSKTGPGSLTFRLSRESVLRGVAGGLDGEAMLARLEKHASRPLPGNVVTQLRSWAEQVRPVKATPVILFRCPDEATAGRVQAALGKRAERVGETMVVWPADEKLNAALRKKLQEQGILLEEDHPRSRRKKR